MADQAVTVDQGLGLKMARRAGCVAVLALFLTLVGGCGNNGATTKIVSRVPVGDTPVFAAQDRQHADLVRHQRRRRHVCLS